MTGRVYGAMNAHEYGRFLATNESGRPADCPATRLLFSVVISKSWGDSTPASIVPSDSSSAVIACYELSLPIASLRDIPCGFTLWYVEQDPAVPTLTVSVLLISVWLGIGN